MAEERNVGLARATDATSDEEPSKEDLQRRMEEARESLSQTVNEIKDTVTNQYQNVRENINEALDWREQVRRRPAAFSAGALAAGFIVGYGVAGGLADDRSSRRSYAYDYDEDDSDDDDTPSSRLYAGQSGLASSSSSGASGYGASATTSTTDYMPSYSGSDYTEAPTSESNKPGLLDRFKETQAFDRLQSEVSSLGDRFVDELSNVARYQVMPALLGKVKELFGIDLSDGGQQSRGGSASAYSGTSYSGSAAGSQPGPYGQSSPGAYGGESGRVDDQRSSDPLSTPGVTGGASFDNQQGSSYGTSVNKDYNQS